MTVESSKVSWIADTEDALNLAKNATEAQRQIAVLDDASSNLAALLTDFQELAAGASVLRSLGWEGQVPNPDLVSDLQQAAKTLGPRPLTNSVNGLERFRSRAKSALIECWHRHAVERLGDVAELRVLAETLSEVEGVTDLSQQLEAVLGELARIQSDVPTRRSAQLLEKAESALHQLEESFQPESVRGFLSAVAHGGASLELLNQNVIDWLVSHSALRSFKIVAGSPADTAHV
ncbi:hypothetical protein [Mycobacterium asiaticum]|uniref:hypothetical protein n=1 Tax=Mycobacterium asiaticum TaxID=1790 RepID=UPI0009B8FB13|nr:hypothetical protein [Mycobacterium asiaticum]